MKTLYTVLPVYDRIEKQAYRRALKSVPDLACPIVTPLHRLPSMQWNVETDNPGEITDIDLIDLDGNISDIQTYFYTGKAYLYELPAGSYDTWIRGGFPPNHVVTSAIKTTAAGEAKVQGIDYPVGPYITEYSTNVYRYDWDLTLNSGVAPKVELRVAATGLTTKSNTVQLVNGRNVFYLVPTLNTGINLSVVLFNDDGDLTNFALDFGDNTETGLISNHPRLSTVGTDQYFTYNGQTLNTLLTAGIYYLKFTTVNGYVYYSDIFKVDCVYPNLITSLINDGYDTLSILGTSILSAIDAGAGSGMYSNSFPVIKGEIIKVILKFTFNTGQRPSAFIQAGGTPSNIIQLTIGLNVLSFIIPETDDAAYFNIYNTAASNFSTSEVLIIREYSEKYLRVNFKNSCDIGDLVYEAGFEQALFIESEPMEQTYPTEEEGQKNGEGKFVRTFARQVKKYNCKAGSFPDYMIDVFNRMKLYDDIELIDTLGDINQVYNLEVEHEWMPPGKYYANINLTFDYDEAVVVMACCVNLSEL